MVAIDLSKQQVLDADLGAIQQINFTDFSQGTVKVLQMCYRII